MINRDMRQYYLSTLPTLPYLHEAPQRYSILSFIFFLLTVYLINHLFILNSEAILNDGFSISYFLY